MGRKQDEFRLDSILTAIQSNPDKRAGAIGSLLGIDDKTMQRALVQLEARGDLFEQDNDDKLRWFGKRR